MPKSNTQFPKFVEVGLKYSFLENDIVYSFLRLRKKDAELDEQEKMLGGGQKFSMAQRLAHLVEDINGFPNFEPRNYDGESEAEWRQRVLTFFSTEENLEMAEDALVGRQNAIYPKPTFRRPQNSGLEVNLVGQAPE